MKDRGLSLVLFVVYVVYVVVFLYIDDNRDN